VTNAPSSPVPTKTHATGNGKEAKSTVPAAGFRRHDRVGARAGGSSESGEPDELTGVNQLWVADITYIRLKREFVYLAAILDAFSRKVVGWELGRTLTTRLPMAAVEKALGERKPPPGLVHHSDRGIQYASSAYVAVLRQHDMIPSMSRPGNPCDNACCESFMKTLKREEIQANEHCDLGHLRENIALFIENKYNPVPLHSALGYRRRWNSSRPSHPRWDRKVRP
jgi:transposase InsO family protein